MIKGAAIFDEGQPRAHDLGTRLNFETRSEEDSGREVALTRAPAHIGENPRSL